MVLKYGVECHIPMTGTSQDLAHGLRLHPKSETLTSISTLLSLLPLFTELVDKPVLPGVCVWAPVCPSLYERKMPMTSEMSEKSYQAVRCAYCSEPIPLSTRLLEIFDAESGNTAEPQSRSQV